jgi:hypothetical protein
MRKLTLTGVLAMALALAGTHPIQAQEQTHDTDWALFSEALVEAMHTPNQGVRLGALQQIATYGSHLEVDEVLFDIVRIYRDASNQNCRILALMALASLEDPWAMDFLERSARFEKNDRIRRHTVAVVNDYLYGPIDAEAARALAAFRAAQTPPSHEEIADLLAVAK